MLNFKTCIFLMPGNWYSTIMKSEGQPERNKKCRKRIMIKPRGG